MGSDSHPEPELTASVEAARLWGDPILLTGPEDVLKPRLEAMNIGEDQVKVVHAPEVLEMTDKPARAARGKSKSSMAVGMDLLKSGEADAFITAGNTGGAMANALFRVGRIKGIKRPALTATISIHDGLVIILDIGANADCKPEYLIQFALLGSLYAQNIYHQPSPRVGLLSNGEEAGKGNQLIKETYPLMETLNINFIGNVEPKELFTGEVDVVVTDGFSGNILIKSSEAVSHFLIHSISKEIKSGALTSLGGLLAKPAFKRVSEMLDPSEYGAAPLLGIDGLVFIGHGRSNTKALISAIKASRQAVAGDLLNSMRNMVKTYMA
jgi:glycerol-3-phosphate acyltransferase PlsX